MRDSVETENKKSTGVIDVKKDLEWWIDHARQAN